MRKIIEFWQSSFSWGFLRDSVSLKWNWQSRSFWILRDDFAAISFAPFLMLWICRRNASFFASFSKIVVLTSGCLKRYWTTAALTSFAIPARISGLQSLCFVWASKIGDSDALNDWLVENKIFDAFEVLGGENYFEQNGYQTVRYYEDKARGYKYPVVGSTDSHNCTPENRNAYICSTIVYSPENERKAIIDSIKNFRSVAVDTISKEFRIVGEMRYVRYGCFLLKNYFPIHDDACFEEGRMMKQAVYGTDEEKQAALAMLNLMNGRMKKMREKYFSF